MYAKENGPEFRTVNSDGNRQADASDNLYWKNQFESLFFEKNFGRLI
jgi:hypothetical protein